MVRFKNRYLLVEFLSPANLRSTLGESSTAVIYSGFPNDTLELNAEDEAGDDDLPILPQVPFLVPQTDAKRRLKLGDESGGAIFKSLRSNILEVFGDEGWGRLSSSFRVIYHSPLTTLTIFRVARQHYRTLWASLTLLREINDQPLIPRVLAVSGTIKKLQNRGIAYHRLVTAQMLSAALAGVADSGGLGRKEEENRLRKEWDREEEAINALEG